ncbi:MAG: hypothetical protein NT034_03925 [Candidatus Magasanikbacteria bacterium]|nr:hypothetical protein [Candidatus Magasanikbacteria bacterium]
MYLSWKTKNITDFSSENINSLYNEGFLFTRTGKGDMYQTRSLRINLNKFKLNSENRRILKHTESITLSVHNIPYPDYDWTIHKLGKDFYATKFGEKTFSAQKIKELITNPTKSNFNRVLAYSGLPTAMKHMALKDVDDKRSTSYPLGYCIALETDTLLHYCYPFYSLKSKINNLGLGMMLKAIVVAKENDKKYVYLGSASRPTDTYKLQFEGIEWFDGEKWQTDLATLKQELK